MKIVLCSDNHSNFLVLDKILSDNPNADYYWHLGDSESESIDRLLPFVSVLGNNDYLKLPIYRVIEVDKHRFLLTHGHRFLRNDLNTLLYLAKENNCDVVLYGHTHIFSDVSYKGVRFINPGSCSHNRDGSKPTYAILDIQDKDIKLLKRTLKSD